MIKAILFLVLLMSTAFAANVELKINGEQYYCSKDPNGTGTVSSKACIEIGCKASSYDCTNNFSKIANACKNADAGCVEIGCKASSYDCTNNFEKITKACSRD